MLVNESENLQLVKKGKISDRVLENLLLDDTDDSDGDDQDSDDDVDSDGSDEDEDFENDDYEKINFVSPDFDNDEPKLPPNLNNDLNTWVILWIIQFQQRFKLSNVAIGSLLKFLNIFLSTIDASKFSSFPSSLYMAKKNLEMPTVFQYGACDKCHKLYDIYETLKTEILTCSFVNHPNYSLERYRKKCGNLLLKKIDCNNNPIFRPIMTFPLVNIKQQLTLFFGRKDFEMACRK